jgi:hypothetical protein
MYWEVTKIVQGILVYPSLGLPAVDILVRLLYSVSEYLGIFSGPLERKLHVMTLSPKFFSIYFPKTKGIDCILLIYLLKSGNLAGCWWLIPVILATWEAEIRRIMVRGQPRQIVLKTLSPK